jgi:hypothetical protein
MSENESVNLKLENLKERLTESDEIFKWSHFEQYLYTFIQGEKDIEDFYTQFIKLMDFYKNNPKLKCSSTKEILQLKYGETLGAQIYEKYQKSNPFRGHKGKLSPFHKGSVNYSEDSVKKAAKNRSYTTRLDYWINKGLTEDEAKIALKERQTTFSLEKCIEKYGEIEGIKRWKQRQEKWLNTLNSKSDDEKSEINKKKDWARNKTSEEIEKILSKRKTGAGTLNCLERPCYLYYIRFYNESFETWKIGITVNSLNERFRFCSFEEKYHLKWEIIFNVKYSNVSEAYEKEQYILEAFKNNRIYTDYNGFKTSETFDKDVLEGYYAKQ